MDLIFSVVVDSTHRIPFPELEETTDLDKALEELKLKGYKKFKEYEITEYRFCILFEKDNETYELLVDIYDLYDIYHIVG